MKYKSLIGMKFGRLFVTRRTPNKTTPSGHTVIYYSCICNCGNIKEVRGISLSRRDHPTRSCGCIRAEEMGKLKGEKNPAWKGGERIETGGYVELYIPSHPKARINGYVKKHRVVMEKYLGRYLTNEENVHHINGNKLDNNIKNLELWNISQPSGQRIIDKVKWAREILKVYKYIKI